MIEFSIQLQRSWFNSTRTQTDRFITSHRRNKSLINGSKIIRQHETSKKCFRSYTSSSSDDPYSVLGLPKGSSIEEIKKSYRMMAMKYHPDKNPDHKALEKFKQVSDAYAILSDAEKKAAIDKTAKKPKMNLNDLEFDYEEEFDEFDEEDMEQMFREAHAAAGFDFGKQYGYSAPKGGPHSEYVGFDPYEDPFAQHYARQHAPPRRPTRKTPDILYKMEVNLEDLYTGKNVSLAYERITDCSTCKGTGTKSGAPAKCKACGGHGSVIKQVHGLSRFNEYVIECPSCHGTGEVIHEQDRCPKCSGTRMYKQENRINFKIEPGTLHGEKLTFKGQSNKTSGSKPGDFKVLIQQRPHKVFKRLKRDDLLAEIKIPLASALCGFEIKLEHLDKRVLLIRETQGPGKKVIRPGTVRVIPGEGMPSTSRTGTRGDLYIKFDVSFPDIPMLDPELASNFALAFRQENMTPKAGEKSSGNYVYVDLQSTGKVVFDEEVHLGQQKYTSEGQEQTGKDEKQSKKRTDRRDEKDKSRQRKHKGYTRFRYL